MILRRLRVATRLTQEALAERSGLSVDAISALESGRRLRPHLSTVDMLADGLGLCGDERERFSAVARAPKQAASRLGTQGGLIDRTTSMAGEVIPPRCTLPRDIASLIGRDRELDLLLATASKAARSRGTVGVITIDGMPGVGKTAFATHAAHQLTNDFPDGQLFLDLHGHTDGRPPLDPSDALTSLLLALGVSARDLPANADVLAALWRDRLAGRRMLILLDDAASHYQIRPLLPGSPGCVVLISSRRRLAALEDVESLTLGPLSLEHAILLFEELAGPGRTAGASAAIAELVNLCGHLPLAIRLLAGKLRTHASWRVHDLLANLRNAHNRLEALEVENRSLRATFNLSYASLPGDLRHLFLCLGLHPGHEFDAHVAATLQGCRLELARSRLERLYEHHLVDEPRAGRYRLHHLLHLHAGELARTHESIDADEVIGRLLDYYRRAAATASRQITSSRVGAVPIASPAVAAELPDIRDRGRATAWLESEISNIIGCIELAVVRKRHADALGLAVTMRSFLRNKGHWPVSLELEHIAVAVSRAAGMRRSQAEALVELGAIHQLAGTYAQASDCLTEAVSVFRECGDDAGQANALVDLGFTQLSTGNYPASRASLLAARTLFEGSGDQVGQARVLTGAGILACLGGDYDGASSSLTHASRLFDDLGVLLGRANVLCYLAIIRQLIGDYESALALLQRSAWLFRRIGNLLGLAHAHYITGMVLRITGDQRTAASLFTRALSGYRAIRSRLGQANVLSSLGLLQTGVGRHPSAIASTTDALAIYRSLGDVAGEAEALNNLGAVLSNLGRSWEAVLHHRQALMLARGIESPLEEARALEGIGKSGPSIIGTDDARMHLVQAHTMYRKIGVPETDRVVATLVDVQGSHAITGA